MEFTPEQITGLLVALGLPEDTTDPQLVIDTVVDLAEQVEQLDPARPSTVAAAAKRSGLEVLDKETVATLRRDAATGRQLAAAAARQKVEASVDKAIDRGAIPLARRKHWVELLAADPAMEQHLAATPDGTAVALTEVGHSTEKDDLAEVAPWFYPTR